jgi:RNA polymerase sigma factor (sigma-70 family)
MNGLDVSGDINEQLNSLLVSVAEGRDRSAFQSLFVYFAPRLKAFVMGQRTDPGLAEEIVQETMLNVWRKADQFEPAKASASTWVFTIARNMRIDMLRKANRPAPDMDDPALVPDSEPPAHERVSRKQESARLRQALVSLPAEQREILRMVFLDDTTHAEAAERLGIPLGTVKSRIRLALKRMRSEVGEEV